MRDDRRLAKQIADGHPGAYAAFVDGYGTRLHRLARHHTACEDDAEDLTQEIFVSLFRGMAGFRGDAALATWAYRIALNHCRTYAGRARAVLVPYDEAFDVPETEERGPAYQAARRELSDQVHAALGSLSPDHREVVLLHEIEELTYRECAAVLQVPEGTVKSRLFHAFRRLRGALSGYVQADALPETDP